MTAAQPTLMIASGASGGHLFPALAVAEAMRERGYRCVFVLGGNKFVNLVQERGFEILRLPASAFNVRNPLRKAMAVLRLGMGLWQAWRFVVREKPALVFGTGGYATVAAILAARAGGTPTVIHEQNVLPGKANRLLSRVARVMLLTFDDSRKYLPHAKARFVLTGMPLRTEVLAARAQVRTEDGTFGILVLGGSQGARILAEVIPGMLTAMEAEERARVRVVHQCRPEEVERLQRRYEKLGLAGFDVASFYPDLPKLYQQTHLVIGRSGTGTLLETATLGRAAIYVPHQMADNHQLMNALVAESAGAAVVVEQPIFTPMGVLVHVRALMKDADRIRMMEHDALAMAVPDATGNVVAALEDVMAARATKFEKE